MREVFEEVVAAAGALAAVFVGSWRLLLLAMPFVLPVALLAAAVLARRRAVPTGDRARYGVAPSGPRRAPPSPRGGTAPSAQAWQLQPCQPAPAAISRQAS